MPLAGDTLDHVLGRGGEQLIVNAVHEAERRTSGEIVVRIAQRIEPPGAAPRAAAEAEFERLNLSRTKHRNGILLYVALDEHAIELVADEGIAAVIAQQTWQAVVEIVSLGFRCDFPAEGIVMAVAKTADLLAEKFPYEAGDVNELPNQIVTDAQSEPLEGEEKS